MGKIKVLILDESPNVLGHFKRILANSNEIDLIGVANNGKEGLQKVRELNPDVICTDFVLPGMNGLEFTKELMETIPKPILVTSSKLRDKNSSDITQILDAGALDIIEKPNGSTEDELEEFRKTLESKIKLVYSIPVFKIKSSRKAESRENGSTNNQLLSTKSLRYVVIGSSTGGPNALYKILEKIPETIPVPIICVQHISDGFSNSLIDWLDRCSKLKVKIMEENEVPIPGKVYFPKDHCHLIVDSSGRLKESHEASFNGHTPSINITFQSFANHYGPYTLGVILTGMGEDGAQGLLSIKNRGGRTIGESQETCVVYGMPRVAKEIGALHFQLPIEEIANKIMSLL